MIQLEDQFWEVNADCEYDSPKQLPAKAKPKISIPAKKLECYCKSSMEKEIPEENDIFCFMQHDRNAANINLKSCILLDNESTVHAFCNKDFLRFL